MKFKNFILSISSLYLMLNINSVQAGLKAFDELISRGLNYNKLQSDLEAAQLLAAEKTREAETAHVLVHRLVNRMAAEKEAAVQEKEALTDKLRWLKERSKESFNIRPEIESLLSELSHITITGEQQPFLLKIKNFLEEKVELEMRVLEEKAENFQALAHEQLEEKEILEKEWHQKEEEWTRNLQDLQRGLQAAQSLADEKVCEAVKERKKAHQWKKALENYKHLVQKELEDRYHLEEEWKRKLQELDTEKKNIEGRLLDLASLHYQEAEKHQQEELPHKEDKIERLKAPNLFKPETLPTAAPGA